MTKTDYMETVATLLSLDQKMTKDLGNLTIETLAKIYVNYIQNAIDVNNKMERLLEIKPTKNKAEVAKRIHNA